MIEIRPARIEDAVRATADLRARDREELLAFGRPLENVIIDGMLHSMETWVGEIDGDIAAMWGIRYTSLLDDRVYVWMLGTTVIAERPLLFLRHSRRVMRALLSRYTMLYGSVHCDFEHSIAWLKWLGADFRVQGKTIAFALK